MNLRRVGARPPAQVPSLHSPTRSEKGNLPEMSLECSEKAPQKTRRARRRRPSLVRAGIRALREKQIKYVQTEASKGRNFEALRASAKGTYAGKVVGWAERAKVIGTSPSE